MATLTTSYQLLAESDSYTYNSNYAGKVCLRLYAKIGSQSVSGNTSTVDIRLVKYLTAQYSNVYYSCYQKDASLSGDLSHTWSDSAYASYYPQTEYIVFERSFSVAHNADGSKSLSLAASYDDSFIAALSVGAVVCSLPTIPRKSSIGGVSLASGAIEQGFSVSFSPASSSFSHRVELVVSGSTIVARDSYSSGVAITLSAAELLALYRMKTKAVTVRLITRSGGSEIGRAETAVTLSALGNAHARTGGQWRRGMICVGASPGVMMIKQDGEWRVAK